MIIVNSRLEISWILAKNKCRLGHCFPKIEAGLHHEGNPGKSGGYIRRFLFFFFFLLVSFLISFLNFEGKHNVAMASGGLDTPPW